MMKDLGIGARTLESQVTAIITTFHFLYIRQIEFKTKSNIPVGCDELPRLCFSEPPHGFCYCSAQVIRAVSLQRSFSCMFPGRKNKGQFLFGI